MRQSLLIALAGVLALSIVLLPCTAAGARVLPMAGQNDDGQKGQSDDGDKDQKDDAEQGQKNDGQQNDKGDQGGQKVPPKKK